MSHLFIFQISPDGSGLPNGFDPALVASNEQNSQDGFNGSRTVSNRTMYCATSTSWVITAPEFLFTNELWYLLIQMPVGLEFQAYLYSFKKKKSSFYLMFQAGRQWLQTTMASRRKKITQHFEDLEQCYFNLRQKDIITNSSSSQGNYVNSKDMHFISVVPKRKYVYNRESHLLISHSSTQAYLAFCHSVFEKYADNI